jgi:hypothetical protein
VTAAGGSLAAFVVLAPVVYPWYLIAPVGVLAAVATERIRSRLAVVLLLASVVVLPDSHNLAISTLWPGGWVELAASIGLSAYAVRRFFARRRWRAAAVS